MAVALKADTIFYVLNSSNDHVEIGNEDDSSFKQVEIS